MTENLISLRALFRSDAVTIKPHGVWNHIRTTSHQDNSPPYTGIGPDEWTVLLAWSGPGGELSWWGIVLGIMVGSWSWWAIALFLFDMELSPMGSCPRTIWKILHDAWRFYHDFFLLFIHSILRTLWKDAHLHVHVYHFYRYNVLQEFNFFKLINSTLATQFPHTETFHFAKSILNHI